MKLVNYRANNQLNWGVMANNGLIDGQSLRTGLPTTLTDVISAGPDVVRSISQAIESGRGTRVLGAQLAVPASPTARIVCVGLNYTKHAIEGGNPIPTYPALFLRVWSSVVADGESLHIPQVSEKLDYEAELMVVIGRSGRYISEANALDHVFGYTVFNDGSIRDYQRKSTQWTAGKNFDSTGAVGPWIVTADELPPGAHGLRIQSRLDGQVMQDSDTSDMIFSVAKVVHTVSEIMTLQPGDLIAMGTPSGVGYARTPPLWMKSGQRLEVEIERIGVLNNQVA
jgi:acylpyruvate hydrolase